MEAIEWFKKYHKTAQTIPGAIEILQTPGETVFVPAGWYHIVVNLTTTLSITHNYASPHVGEIGIKKIWNEIVQQEPEFAKRWYKNILTRHLNNNGSNDNNATSNNSINSASSNSSNSASTTVATTTDTGSSADSLCYRCKRRQLWMKTSNVVKHIQDEHNLLLQNGSCNWKLEECYTGLCLDDLSNNDYCDCNGTNVSRKSLKSIILELENNGEIVNVQVKDEERNGGEKKIENNNKDETSIDVLYEVVFTSIVILDNDNNIFLIKHRSGEWTPPGGKIEKNENSLQAAKREYIEETGISIDHLISKGLLKFIGVHLYFHPELARSPVKEGQKSVSF